MTLTIEHTEAEGTLLLGTSRGDGSAEVVKALGWRWGRSIGLWFVPRSRDTAPKRPLIEQTARQLREAGFEVEVSIDTTTGDREAAEARRAERAVVALGAQDALKDTPRQYLNRLSDLMFVLSRVLNRFRTDGTVGDDVYWKSEKMAKAAAE